MADIATRFKANPLLKPEDLKPSSGNMKIECVMNPGAFRFDGKIWLVLRVAERPEFNEETVAVPYFGNGSSIDLLQFDRADSKLVLSDPRYVIYDDTSYLSTLSHLRLVCSEDGIHFREPGDIPSTLLGKGNLEEFGIEDCRVIEIEGEYLLTYTEVSRCGVGVGLITTKDWRSFRRVGMIFPPHNKDCAIFGERIGGKYYCFHRPSGLTLGGNFLWLSASEDLIHWGEHKCIMQTRPGMWDSERIGAGAAPILTREGWLAIYHGADNSHRYCLGAVLLDKADPSKVLARTDEPIMEPSMPYERSGFFDNVVFTNGHVVDGDIVTLYYGAADLTVCGATLSINAIMSRLGY